MAIQAMLIRCGVVKEPMQNMCADHHAAWLRMMKEVLWFG